VETYVHRIGRTGRAGKEGTAISLVQAFERRKQQAFERHNRQTWQILSIPTKAQIEAQHIQKLRGQVAEALTGERLASFLPIISEMIEEYDAHAIAAAALQIAYDQTRPAWLLSGVDLPVEESPTPKPRINKRGDSGERERSSGGGRGGRSSWSKEGKGNDDRRSSGGGSPKPKLKITHHESSPSPSNHKLGLPTGRE